jgi:type VI secretion system secreted protein VgrG
MGTTFKQAASSLFKITTPLGADKLLLKGFRGSEGMSRLFRFELDLLSEDNGIDYTQIIGKSVTIGLKRADGSERYFNGIISRFGQGGSENVFTSYRAEMVPWLWLLTRTADCRIFQNKTIPDIIKQVFSDLGFSEYVSDKLQGSYTARDYCVQYRETAFNFVSRLMEEYGIYYYFTHDNGKHTLVLGDSPNGNVDCPGQNSFRFYIESTAVLDEDVVNGWHAEQELRTGKCTLSDYNFETPSTSLLSTTNTIDSVGGNSKFETYDYPGEYLKKADGDKLVKVRMEEEESIHMVIHGTSDARSMVSGCKFTLKEHYRDDMNAPYLLTDIEHVATTTSYGNARGAQQDHYSNSFRCIPASVPFRPLRLTPHPTVAGPQTALVVGPSGEEIYVDKYGRVKVQFYWDRQGKKDENSTCWIRVAQGWAGKNWGMIFHPRMGQEVVVDFLEGDPDQPLITGRVYNQEQMPPYALPGNMTQSGILTRSSKSGTADNFNQLRFEDKKGSEEVYFHAEKDMNVVVENNETLKVGSSNSNTSPDGSRTHTVYNNDSLTVTNGNRTVEVKTGNETHTIDQGNETLTVKTGNRVVEVNTGNDTHTVKTGNRTVEVKTGNDSHTVKMGNRSVEVSMGNDSLTVKMGNQTTKLNLGAASTEAMQSITLKVGQSSITVDQMGVTIKGMMISVQGQVQTQIKGLMTQVNGDAMLQCKGGITMIN